MLDTVKREKPDNSRLHISVEGQPTDMIPCSKRNTNWWTLDPVWRVTTI